MDARHSRWLEKTVDLAAAAALAAAIAYAAVKFGYSSAIAGALSAAALLASVRLLRSIDPNSPRFALPPFTALPLPEAQEVDELLLTESDRLDQIDPAEATDELVLDDVLARLEDFSRVVRLFDRSAMPTPDEPKTRIDRHLDGSRSASPDASQALHDALSELRRTLR